MALLVTRAVQFERFYQGGPCAKEQSSIFLQENVIHVKEIYP